MSQALKKIQNNMFILFVFAFISFIYYANVKLVWIERVQSNAKYVYLTIFNLVFFMLFWSMLKTMFTDPGRVPLHWGYFLDDPDQKKRRYCLICHIFKPERCHHCSACNRCVLNMDHHCPWINNCVGFFNRKFFILMLVYVIIATILVFFGMIGEIFNIFSTIDHYASGDKDVTVFWFSDFIIIVAFLLDITALVVISIFLKFHITLILTNSTTIENLDKKRVNSKSNTANFDMGNYYNWVQVFGKTPWLWPFPVFLESGKPVGDGIVYPQRYQEEPQQTEVDKLKSPNTQRSVQENGITKIDHPLDTQNNTFQQTQQNQLSKNNLNNKQSVSNSSYQQQNGVNYSKDLNGQYGQTQQFYSGNQQQM